MSNNNNNLKKKLIFQNENKFGNLQTLLMRF